MVERTTYRRTVDLFVILYEEKRVRHDASHEVSFQRQCDCVQT